MHNPEVTTQDQAPQDQAAQGQMPQNQPLEEILPTALIIRAEYLILFNHFC